jgi:hypothetical protein
MLQVENRSLYPRIAVFGLYRQAHIHKDAQVAVLSNPSSTSA